jgi:hypothetical protein
MANALNDNLQQMATPEGALNLVAHTAWHGSPHLFDAFKNEAIGTGEGAQAYGHGLYLAEHPEVAQGYQKTLAPERNANDLNTKMKFVRIGEKPLDSYGVEMSQDLIDAAKNGSNDLKYLATQKQARWQQLATDETYPFKDYATDKVNSYNSLLADLHQQNPQYIGGGNLYKTDIPDAHIDKMLDWDKPLSEQSQHVQDALGVIQRDHVGEDALFEKARQLGVAPTSLPEYAKLEKRMDAARKFSDMTGEQFYRYMGGTGDALQESRAAFSDTLNQAGIPGIKYLDGSSRAGGEGTRNFVMFNPDDIRILERNGVATGQQPFADDLLSQFKAQQANK